MVRVEIQGLAEIQKVLSNDSSLQERFLPEFGYLISSFHNMLQQEVHAQYNTKRSLTSVLVGGLTPRSMGKRLMTGSLEYWEKPLSLHEFVTRTEDFLPSGWFTSTKGDDAFMRKKRRNKTPNQKQFVSVRKGREVMVQGKAQQGAFVTTSSPKFLASRAQAETFLEEPSESNPKGKRAKSDILFTIGLAKMAENVFVDFAGENNGRMTREFDKLHNRLADAFLDSLRG